MLPQNRYLKKCSEYLSQISLEKKNCLVIGGTQGIGKSVAVKLSAMGANVTIAGRSKTAGSSTIENLRNRESSETQKHSFERVDLVRQSDVKRFLASVSAKLQQSGGLDYLFLTAGKPPIGKQSLTEDGTEAHFALQCLGRYNAAFTLASIMNTDGAITAVCAPGGGTSAPYDDLEYLKPENTAKYGMLAAGGRDSLFVDSVLWELAEQQQARNISVSHLYPGGINTTASQTAGFPFPIPLLARTFGPYVLTSPDDYAVAPIYEAIMNQPRATHHAKNQYGTDVKMKDWVNRKENRTMCLEYAKRRIAAALEARPTS